MAEYLTISNLKTKEDIIHIPITQSGRVNTRGIWLYQTLEQNSESSIVETKSINYKPNRAFEDECHWVIDTLRTEAERVTYSVS